MEEGWFIFLHAEPPVQRGPPSVYASGKDQHVDNSSSSITLSLVCVCVCGVCMCVLLCSTAGILLTIMHTGKHSRDSLSSSPLLPIGALGVQSCVYCGGLLFGFWDLNSGCQACAIGPLPSHLPSPVHACLRYY